MSSSMTDSLKRIHMTEGPPGQGAKKASFTACHSGDLKLAFMKPNFIPTGPTNFFDVQNWFHSSSVISISQKNFTCPSDKLRTKLTSPIPEFTIAPGYRTQVSFHLALNCTSYVLKRHINRMNQTEKKNFQGLMTQSKESGKSIFKTIFSASKAYKYTNRIFLEI